MEVEQLSLRDIQLAEFDILKVFHEFCQKYGLAYSLVGGTLLGAVRHKGFIPWDDDIDVGMPRPDYEKFFSILQENRFIFPDNNNLIVLPDRGEQAKLPFIKIIDSNIDVYRQYGQTQINEKLWIDIFPFDGYPSDDKETQSMCNELKSLRRLLIWNIMKGRNQKGIKKFVAKLYMIYVHMYGVKRALRQINMFVEKYPYESSPFIGGLVWGAYGEKERIAANSFEHLVDVEFEGGKFKAISNFDEYLGNIFGDYMQLPPVDKRVSHGIFIAYRK